MRKITISALLVCTMVLSVSSTGKADSSADSLSPEFLPAEKLNKEFFAKYATGISSDVFEERWKHSLSSELTFLQSHVRAYYVITQNAAYSGSPSGLCFGDAHANNFGFIESKHGDPRYLYNDLDDSGYCPVSLEALRYFTSLQMIEDAKDVQPLIEYYTDLLAQKQPPSSIPAQFVPDFKHIRNKEIQKLTDGDKLVRISGTLENVLPAVEAQTSSLVREALSAEGFKQVVVKDVSEAKGHGYGSYGLTRYWALADVNGTPDIIEVKETVEPATDFLKAGSFENNRIDALKDAFWGGPAAARVYREGCMFGKSWVVRNRVKVSLDSASYPAAERIGIYKTQISQLADLHRRAYGANEITNAKQYNEWLKVRSQELKDLFEKVYNSAIK